MDPKKGRMEDTYPISSSILLLNASYSEPASILCSQKILLSFQECIITHMLKPFFRDKDSFIILPKYLNADETRYAAKTKAPESMKPVSFRFVSHV